jgi:hypothetical protein
MRALQAAAMSHSTRLFERDSPRFAENETLTVGSHEELATLSVNDC